MAAEWSAALLDACIDAAEIVLFVFEGTCSDTGYAAKTWPPGDPVNEPGDVGAFGRDLQRANTEPLLVRMRVAIWSGRGREAIAGLMRHELEHVRQFARHSPDTLAALHDAAILALDASTRDAPRGADGGLIGGGTLYNRVPMEQDANAAAARYVRSRFGDDRIDQIVAANDPDVAVFRRNETVQPVETVLERMRRFINEEAAELGRLFVAQRTRP